MSRETPTSLSSATSSRPVRGEARLPPAAARPSPSGRSPRRARSCRPPRVGIASWMSALSSSGQRSANRCPRTSSSEPSWSSSTPRSFMYSSRPSAESTFTQARLAARMPRTNASLRMASRAMAARRCASMWNAIRSANILNVPTTSGSSTCAGLGSMAVRSSWRSTTRSSAVATSGSQPKVSTAIRSARRQPLRQGERAALHEPNAARLHPVGRKGLDPAIPHRIGAVRTRLPRAGRSAQALARRWPPARPPAGTVGT